MGGPYSDYDLETQADYAEPTIFWSVDTPGGSILLAQCAHPDSNGEHPDVPLQMRCEQHQRTAYYCDDLARIWCDGGPPEYVWHFLELIDEVELQGYRWAMSNANAEEAAIREGE